MSQTRWVAEAREPDGTWQTVVEAHPDLHLVIRQLRRWRRDRGHLMPETRVRVAGGG